MQSVTRGMTCPNWALHSVDEIDKVREHHRNDITFLSWLLKAIAKRGH